MRRIALALAALLAFAAPAPMNASAHGASPRAFLDRIYAHYRGSADSKTGQGVLIDTPAKIRRYFEPGLAKLMIADEAAAAKAGDVPALDGDPFIDAQDWDIQNLTVHIDDQTKAAAHATVRFTNLKDPKTVHLDLVHTQAGWRIAEIRWSGDDTTLRGLYVKK